MSRRSPTIGFMQMLVVNATFNTVLFPVPTLSLAENCAKRSLEKMGEHKEEYPIRIGADTTLNLKEDFRIGNTVVAPIMFRDLTHFWRASDAAFGATYTHRVKFKLCNELIF